MNDVRGDTLYAEWVEWLFREPQLPKAGSIEPFSFFKDDQGCRRVSDIQQALYMTLLLTGVGELLAAQSPERVGRIVFSLWSSGYWQAFPWQLSRESRQQLFQAMVCLYTDYAAPLGFSHDRSGSASPHTALFMWWDLGYGFDRRQVRFSQAKYAALDAVTQDIIEGVLKALVRIISLKSEFCVTAALHGLNHLYHPFARSTVEELIDQRREDLGRWGILEYARKCALGREQ
jgi:hypothetical protein